MNENIVEMISSVNRVVDDEVLARDVVRQILRDFGGMQLYLPKADSAFRVDDDKEIAELYNGTNMKQICRKYNVASNTVYAIVRREKDRKAKERAERSQGVFNFN